MNEYHFVFVKKNVGHNTHRDIYNQRLFYQPSSISEITSYTFFKYKKVKYHPTNKKMN